MSASWSKKDPSENFVVDFNFPDATVNLTAATVTVELVSGTDATPEAMLVGSVTLVGKTAQQRVGVGQPGCRYNFKCVASALFATYAVARHLGTSLAMMAPKAITDGKAGFTRFSDGPYKSVLLQVEKQYENTRNALAGALSTLNSTVASDIPLVFFGVASPATDPVIE
jgi:vacuolar-type H+-ATPase subunit B/Vma2